MRAVQVRRNASGSAFRAVGEELEQVDPMVDRRDGAGCPRAGNRPIWERRNEEFEELVAKPLERAVQAGLGRRETVIESERR
jgi:hypothetical protein